LAAITQRCNRAKLFVLQHSTFCGPSLLTSTLKPLAKRKCAPLEEKFQLTNTKSVRK